MKRGAVTKKRSRLVNFYAPESLVDLIEAGVVFLDTDRSKFIRQAIREKAGRHGLKMKEAA